MIGPIEQLLADRIGLDLSTVGAGLIARGVQVRMANLGLGDPGEYERLLSRSDAEQQALVEESRRSRKAGSSATILPVPSPPAKRPPPEGWTGRRRATYA